MILLDEPFSVLNLQTCLLTQVSVSRIIAARGKECHSRHHDIDEAIAMADRLLVL
ncbi:ABC-type nitrate/sulfonate/bicarbonate transport system ATPase subunit [Bradyrhizobium sp. GM24.11]